MLTFMLSALLALQLLLTPAPQIPDSHPVPVLWGMIDPEMSLWFSRVPKTTQPGRRVLWDFSWRGFLAALTMQPLYTEDAAHAPQV